MTDSYFAQARYYDARSGRFISEDKVRGHKTHPDSINHYLYCYNRPIKNVDLDGLEPTSEAYIPSGYNAPNAIDARESDLIYIYYTEPFENAAEWQKEQLEADGMNVTMIAISENATGYEDQTTACTTAFVEAWNDMPDTVNSVYIYSHGNERGINFGSEGNYATTDAMTYDGKNYAGGNVAATFDSLDSKNVGTLNLVSCNGGHVDALEINGANPASEFAGLIGDGNYVYAWDGSVMVGYKWAWYTNLFNLGWAPHLSNTQTHFRMLIDEFGYPDRDPYGLIMYKGYDKNCDE